MSRVLITNEKDVRFIATTAQVSPRALQDAYTGSRTFLNALLAEKSDQVKTVTAAATKRKQLHPTHFNAEAILQGGVLIKEFKNKAEQKALETFSKAHENYLDENNDFNEFFQ
jgi:hypothetical protein